MAASFPIQVRFYELDPYGHVNHATYLQYFEAARVDWLGSVGQGLRELQDGGVQLVVTAVATRFVTPALLGEELLIETELVAHRKVRAQWAQHARRDGDLIACQRVNFATVNPAGRPIRIPASLIEAMDGLSDGVPGATELARELPELAL